MGAPYETKTDLQSPLIRTALSLSGSRLNPLVLMTDPERTLNLLLLVSHMPPGSAVIYRHFGQPGLEAPLRELAYQRSIQFLIGNDPELAEACSADGVHFSRRMDPEIIQMWRERHPDWLISSAASKPWSITPALNSLDAVFASPVFASNSPSSGSPFGVEALNKFADISPCPVFALGGITNDNAAQLAKTGIAGIASIGGLRDALETEIRKTSPAMNKLHQSVSISKKENDEQIVFTAEVEGHTHTGELTLRRIADDLWNANHTGVPREIGGRGVGKALVRAMVEDARQSGYKVFPGCPFVAKLFERFPDWAEGVEVQRPA